MGEKALGYVGPITFLDLLLDARLLFPSHYFCDHLTMLFEVAIVLELFAYKYSAQ